MVFDGCMVLVYHRWGGFCSFQHGGRHSPVGCPIEVLLTAMGWMGSNADGHSSEAALVQAVWSSINACGQDVRMDCSQGLLVQVSAPGRLQRRGRVAAALHFSMRTTPGDPRISSGSSRHTEFNGMHDGPDRRSRNARVSRSCRWRRVGWVRRISSTYRSRYTGMSNFVTLGLLHMLLKILVRPYLIVSSKFQDNIFTHPAAV